MIITIPPHAHRVDTPAGRTPSVVQFIGPESAEAFSSFARMSLTDHFTRKKCRLDPGGITVVLMDDACLHSVPPHDLVTFSGWLPQLNAAIVLLVSVSDSPHARALENRRVLGLDGNIKNDLRRE